MEKTRQKESKPPSETMNQDSIEELLAQAAQSMDQLESQLGGDADDDAVIEEVAPEALDSTLAQVEEELEGLQSQITAEETSGKPVVGAVPPSVAETDSESIAQADDILSSLAMELEELNKNLSDPGEPQASTPAPAPAVDASPASDSDSTAEESIDDLLNQFSQVTDNPEIAEIAEIVETPEVTDDDESLEELLGQSTEVSEPVVQAQPEPENAEPVPVENTIDDLLIDMVESPMDTFQPGSQSVVEDALSELNRMGQTVANPVESEPVDELIDALANEPASAEPVASEIAAIMPIETPTVTAQAETEEENFVADDLFSGRAKKKKADPPESAPVNPLSDDDQMVLDELEQASQGGGGPSGGVAPVNEEGVDAEGQAEPGQAYAQFTAPQRAVLKTLDAVNRPFQVVPKQANDTLGMVAVVTLMISMVATALFLLSQ